MSVQKSPSYVERSFEQIASSCVCVCLYPVYMTLDEVSDLVGEMRFHTSTVKTSSARPYAYLHASPLHVHCHGNRVAVVAASRGRAACYAGRQAGKNFPCQDICIFFCVCVHIRAEQTDLRFVCDFYSALL